MKNSQAGFDSTHSLVLFLRENFKYDELTGVFSRAIYVGGGANVGNEAGHIRRDGYRSLSCKRKRILTHRAIWLYVYGEEPSGFMDHINGIKSDNRLCNLRIVNKSQNGLNRDKQANNTTGFKGVCFDKNRNKFMAQTTVNGKHYFIGRFESIEDAMSAYQHFCTKMHGDYFYKNNVSISLAADLKAAA